MNTGFITIHRKILEWEWYDHIPTKTLFIHCLLRANHKSGKWRGQAFKRGEFITSIKTLSIETGLSEKQVRTSLDNLMSTNEVGKQSTSRNTVISIVNYDLYQSKGKPNGKTSAKSGQGKGKEGATDNNVNNNNNENNETKKTNVFSEDVLSTYYSVLNLFDESTHPNNDQQVNNWMDTIDKLNRIDGLSFDDIFHLIKVTREDDFWSTNFLSVTKLRKKNKEEIPYWKVFYNKFKQSNNNKNTVSYEQLEEIRRQHPDA